jgi:hypothetical protein
VLLSPLQALTAKYLDPPKSLQEAAKRSWRPIRERTLQWDRRRQKAVATQALTAQQLLQFFDTYLHPDGVQHKALCVQIWGGSKGVLAAAGAAAGEQGAAADSTGGGMVQQLVVQADDVEKFKQGQPLMPAADMCMPPPAVGCGSLQAAL